MIPTENRLFVNPSKQTSLIVSVIWAIGVLGLIIDKSNFFRDKFSLIGYAPFAIFIAATGSGIITIWRNYSKHKKQNSA
jgi:hypothetical protein